jgi:DNA-binding NarL/FixJ family response regulator
MKNQDSQTPGHSPILDDFVQYATRLSEHQKAVANALALARQAVQELENIVEPTPDQTQPRRDAIRGLLAENNVGIDEVVAQPDRKSVGYIPAKRKKRRKKHRHITRGMHREMMRRHANGDGATAIAKSLNIAPSTVSSWVEDTKNGVVRTYVGERGHRSNHPSHFSPEKRKEVEGLARAGWTAQEIAELADISESTARRYVQIVRGAS